MNHQDGKTECKIAILSRLTTVLEKMLIEYHEGK